MTTQKIMSNYHSRIKSKTISAINWNMPPVQWSRCMEKESWFVPLPSYSSAPAGWDNTLGPWGLREKEKHALSDDVLEAAAWAWASPGYPHGWGSVGNEKVLEFLGFCLRTFKYRKMLLRIIARAMKYPEDMNLNVPDPRYEQLLKACKSDQPGSQVNVADGDILQDMKGTLEKYYHDHDLRTVLAEIKKPDTNPLTQEDFIPFMHPDVSDKFKAIWEEETKDDMWGTEKGLPWCWAMLCMHLMTVHALSDDFDERCKGVCAQTKDVEIKTYERMQNKANTDHRHHKGFPGALNVDMLRKGFTSPDAAGQLDVWEKLQQKFPGILRVKNHFLKDADELLLDPPIRFILINAELNGGALKKLLEPGVLENAKESVKKSNQSTGSGGGGVPGGRMLDACIICLRKLAKEVPTLEEKPIKMAVELQLHLKFYVEKKKDFHLHYKIIRAGKFFNLHSDCTDFFNDCSQ